MQDIDWPFEDEYNTMVLTTKAVIHNRMPILYVSHDEDDGMWQFLDGSDVMDEDALIVGLGEVVNIDPTLKALADLPLGWRALREGMSGIWQREERTVTEVI